MKNEYQKLYTAEDIYNAFNSGLSSAVFVLEHSLVLPIEERIHMLEGLKKMIKNKKDNELEIDLTV